LQKLQENFITTLNSNIAANSGYNHVTLYFYAINSRAYHVRAAVSTPLASDGLAATLLFQKEQSIVAQCLAGINRKDVEKLAQHFEQEKTQLGYWSAAAPPTFAQSSWTAGRRAVCLLCGATKQFLLITLIM
jgi:hypothetical protein